MYHRKLATVFENNQTKMNIQ